MKVSACAALLGLVSADENYKTNHDVEHDYSEYNQIKMVW